MAPPRQRISASSQPSYGRSSRARCSCPALARGRTARRRAPYAAGARGRVHGSARRAAAAGRAQYPLARVAPSQHCSRRGARALTWMMHLAPLPREPRRRHPPTPARPVRAGATAHRLAPSCPPRRQRECVDHTTAALLGAIAGAVDAAGWIALAGLLPSHLTASLVMIGASGGRDSSEVSARLAMVPVFVLTVALVKILARSLHARGLPVLQSLLTLLTVSLTIFCVVGTLTDSLLAEDPCVLLGVGGIGVASMAVQNTIMRLCLTKQSPTTVMTGNLTQFVMAVVDLLSASLAPGKTARVDRPPHGRAPDEAPTTRLCNAGMPLMGFVLGSVTCGWFASRHGLLSLSLPVALSACAAVRSWCALTPESARTQQAVQATPLLLFSVDTLRAGG